jgi:hypothetical protein
MILRTKDTGADTESAAKIPDCEIIAEDSGAIDRRLVEHEHSGDICPGCDATRQAGRAELLRWDIAREQTATIEAILNLHMVCTPPAVIAQRLHLHEATVRYVIQHQEWPQVELFEGGVSR